jgi:hypothetical protein
MGHRKKEERRDIISAAYARLVRAHSVEGDSVLQASAAFESLRWFPPLNSRVTEEVPYLTGGPRGISVVKGSDSQPVTIVEMDMVSAYPVVLSSTPIVDDLKVHNVNTQRENRRRPKVGGAKGKKS